MRAFAWSSLGAIPVVLLSACTAEQQPTSGAPPAIVETVTVRPETIPNIIELPGRIEAVRTAEVRARTDGIIERRLYEEGGHVVAGAPLFRIDPRDYQAQVEAAQATLERAEAARANAEAVLRRYQPLVEERAISGQEFDSARSSLRQAEAQVAEARAALARAELLLSYTTVRAPITGRVGQAEVTEGALVSAGEATLLTRIDQVSPVYAVFTVSSAQMLDTVQLAQSGGLNVSSMDDIKVRLILENGTAYAPVGRLDFTSATVSPETGTQVVRARFDNPEGLLRPGEFVRGKIEAGTIAGGIAVPARAVQMQGAQANVSVLSQDGTVVSRPVTLGELTGGRWIIHSGLRAGEQVIVEGWQKVRPGQKAQTRAAAGQKAPSQPAASPDRAAAAGR